MPLEGIGFARFDVRGTDVQSNVAADSIQRLQKMQPNLSCIVNLQALTDV
jgi:hypothetical protein